ncbi:CHAT domain-containing protein, partial [Terfezia claveryi]
MDCLLILNKLPGRSHAEVKEHSTRLFRILRGYKTRYKDSYTEIAESSKRWKIPARTLEGIASILYRHYELYPNGRSPSDYTAWTESSLTKSNDPPSADVLDMAINFQRHALARVNPLSEEKLWWDVNLSLMLSQRYLRNRSEETKKDIDEATKLCEDAGKNCGEWLPGKRAHLQSILSKQLGLMWNPRVPESVVYLDWAIILLTNAVMIGRELLRGELPEGDKNPERDILPWTVQLEEFLIEEMQYHLNMRQEVKCAEVEEKVKKQMEEALKSNEKIKESERWVGKAQVLLTRAKLKYLRFRKNQNDEEGRKKQLNQAIEDGIQALNTATGLQHNSESLVALNIRDTLATFYLARYDTCGDADDLKTAERYARKCVKRLRKERGSAEITYLYPRACNSLAAILVQRYKLNNVSADIYSAIDFECEAVERSYSDGLLRATYTVTLGQYLEIKSELQLETEGSEPQAQNSNPNEPTPTTKTLCEAIKLVEVVWNRLEAHGNQLIRLALRNTIASLYSELYKRDKTQLQILEMGLERAQQGVDAEFDGADKVGIFSTLSEAYSLSPTEGQMQKAVDYAQKALDACPVARFQRAELEYQLGNLLSRLHRDNLETEIDTILGPLSACVDRKAAPPSFRLKAAVLASTLLEQTKRWAQLYEITKKAMKIIPFLCIKVLPQRDQQSAMRSISGLGSTAAAAALELGQDRAPIAEALSLLEQGRDVIAGNRFDTRADLTALREDPEGSKLAERFEALREELDPAGVSVRMNLRADSRSAGFGQSPKELDGITTRVLNANEKFQQLLVEIRAKDHFKDFLRLPNEKAMTDAACDGTIVVVNVAGWRSDAFIVRKNKPITICRLPKLKQADVKEFLQYDPRVDISIPPVDISSKKILAWIWNSIAEPVLVKTLKYEKDYSSLEELTTSGPRIWWVLTRETSRLPVHAGASEGVISEPIRVFDRVVSSYTTSIKSLIFSREQLAKRLKDKTTKGKHALLCGLMNTKYDKERGLRSVNNAESETQAIKEILEKDRDVDVVRWATPKTAPYAEAVCNALSPPSTPTPSIFHFSGHGSSSPLDPSSSAIYLYDQPLDVASLLQARVFTAAPILAYLSACSTGTTTLLPDEGVHVMSGFVSAGFMNVIGTLWDVDDIVSSTVAISMYKRWVAIGRKPDGLAGCLQWAVGKLREDGTEGKGMARNWACFVHMGV